MRSASATADAGTSAMCGPVSRTLFRPLHRRSFRVMALDVRNTAPVATYRERPSRPYRRAATLTAAPANQRLPIHRQTSAQPPLMSIAYPRPPVDT